MKRVCTEAAVGMVLGHDMTQIIPGQSKGPRFRAGHVVRPEDIPVLLSMGKEHIYIMDIPPEMLHEEAAARRIATALAGPNTEWTEPQEGRVNVTARVAGLARIDAARLRRYNSIGEVQVATLADRTAAQAGQVLAGTRVTPLIVDEAQVLAAEGLGQEGPTVWLEPFRALPTGIVVTGSEVYKGRVEDRFGPTVAAKVQALAGCPVVYHEKSPDDPEMIVGRIQAARAAGAELILVTGGMSVDPDDATPGAIKRVGARIVTYGAPVLPGSMFLMAYWDEIPVMGLPGAVMHDPITLFDWVLPRVLAGEVLTRADFIEWGHGGLIQRRS